MPRDRDLQSRGTGRDPARMRSVWPLVLLCAGLLLAPPLRAETRAQAEQAQLDRLFAALRTAPDETVAALLEARIRHIWRGQASPAVALLMARGDRDVAHDARDDALADFDAVLDLAPDYAEGYAHRAVARAAAGDYAGAVRDIEQALRREPRDFVALRTLSRIAEEQSNWRGALDAWRRALDIDPRMPDGAQRLEMLRKKAEGEAT